MHKYTHSMTHLHKQVTETLTETRTLLHIWQAVPNSVTQAAIVLTKHNIFTDITRLDEASACDYE